MQSVIYRDATSMVDGKPKLSFYLYPSLDTFVVGKQVNLLKCLGKGFQLFLIKNQGGDRKRGARRERFCGQSAGRRDFEPGWGEVFADVAGGDRRVGARRPNGARSSPAGLRLPGVRRRRGFAARRQFRHLPGVIC